MTTTLRTIVENLPTWVGTAPTFADNGGTYMVGISTDRTVLYGSSGNGVFRTSSNDGVTWTTRTTINGSTWGIQGAYQLPNGEVLLSVNAGGAAGQLWRSSGWVANPATATWTQVLTSSGVGAYFSGQFGGVSPSLSNGRILVCEYGTHSHEATTPNQAAIRAYLSSDYGVTWTEVFNLLTTSVGGTVYGSNSNSHLHGCCYDEVWGRLWLSFGDSGATAYCGLVYSDDLGATWAAVPLSTDNTGSAIRQSTTILAMKDCILFGADGTPPGIYRIMRRGYRTMGPLEVAHYMNASGGLTAGRFWQPPDVPGYPALLPMTQAVSHGAGNGQSFLVGTDGHRFWTIHRDNFPTSAFFGYNRAFLMASGTLLVRSTDGRQTNDSRVTLAGAAAYLPGE